MKMYIYTLIISLIVLTGHASDKANNCPTLQEYESDKTISNFVVNPGLTARKSVKSKLREATLFHRCDKCEISISSQVNLEYRASYIYHLMSMFFERDDVNLPGFAKFFAKSSAEEREHAEKFMRYLNLRGGNLLAQDIQKPDSSYVWDTPLAALQTAFKLESQVYESIRKLHDIAALSEDFHLMDFLESHFFTEQVDSLNQLSSWMTRLKRMGCGLGETLFDKELSETLTK